MTAPFIGIYSFPKSGNTWMRQILAELYFGGDIGSVPDIHRQDIHEAPAANVSDERRLRIYKSHAATLVERVRGKPVPHEAIIYLKRHPLDVFLSYLNFLRQDVNKAPPQSWLFKPFRSVEELVENGEIASFLEAYLLFGTVAPDFAIPSSWFQNVAFWQRAKLPADNGDIPVITIHYEDMVMKGVEALEPIREYLGVRRSDMESAFSRAAGKTKKDGKFFWKQTPGLYKEMLPPHLIRRFADYHGERVRGLGYEIEMPLQLQPKHTPTRSQSRLLNTRWLAWPRRSKRIS